MQTIGAMLVAIGAVIGFGAKNIVLGKWRPKDYDENEQEFLNLVEKGTIYVKIVGFIIVVIGFLFIFV